ncbi:ABC transporter ATP-binding protein [Kibdelosporangium persicum]|uniref:High-affinity branched-chain amino acid transport ATP-binding protein LivF n=1 Tax=Kibdelosporangium persicum TaxID=2698649 RepID=A0ABX2EZ29_9PSEU|nr:ABC transporter ATP-binding protein [Kibdelosporangium persicum]NRN64284.1 High-affinity branched-chain amino acid transport ATP-binding protein LivF [Kibdelosporangium persicum]
MLSLSSVVTRYGAVHALNGVDIAVPEGTLTAVLGANGAGKTTLLRTISGLVAPAAGSISFDGTEIAGLPADRVARMGLGHVPEHGGVIRELTVRENLRLGGLWRRNLAFDEVLALFPPLAGKLGRQASTLSGGERQMLAIGRALMARPRVLLLDEPSLGLAPLVTAAIMRVLRDLRDRTGLTVLLVEQNARSALSVAERAYVLALGEVALAGSAESISAEALHEAYLGVNR